ncbi:MAG TPA: HlyD family efflux transporter periplasmic adaptor subunit [Methylomirabilota bacterium]|jgi:HlyD family secretion protein|nr:HlyD family efflux transporter periplasmic adaptor subunit [Methylomirabilota bacterium]
MDIARPELARAKKVRRAIYGSVALVALILVTIGIAKLKPAAPTVDRSTVWSGTVARGNMLRQVRGLGTLVPEDIRWIPAQSNARVDRIVLRSGAIVKPDSIILELSDPQLQDDALTAQLNYQEAEADYENLKVQLDSQLMALKEVNAGLLGQYNQDRLQAQTDKQLADQGLKALVLAQQSQMRADQEATQLKLDNEKLSIQAEANKAQLDSQAAKVDSARALYNLKKSQLDALHVRAGINGVLQDVPVDVGQQVTPGTNLCRVADPTHLKATIQVAETQAKDVALGQKASIDTRNGIVPGHVTRVAGSVVNGTVDVDVSIDGPLPPGARPDLSVDGTIEIENLQNVLYVGLPVHGEPNSTVGLFKLVDGGDEAERTTVKLGRASVTTIEVLDGLHEGDQVILSDMSAWDSVDRIKLK